MESITGVPPRACHSNRMHHYDESLRCIATMHCHDALTYLLGGEAGILVGANHDANVYGLTANQNEC